MSSAQIPKTLQWLWYFSLSCYCDVFSTLRKIKENLDSDQDLQTPNLTVFTLLQEEEEKKKTFSQVGPKMCSSLAKLYNRATVNDDWKVLQELKVVMP